MIIKFIGNLIVGVIGSYILLITAYHSIFTLQNIIDAGFVVGMLLTSFGIITLTNATQVFQGITFSFKQMFSRKNYTHLAFYDYKRSKQQNREKTTGVPTLAVGLLFITVSAVISYIYFIK